MAQRRLALIVIAATALVTTGCSGSEDDENPGGLTRIDGPAQVEDNVGANNAGSTDG